MQDLAAACEGSFRATGFGSSVVFDLKSKEHRAVAIGEDWQSIRHPGSLGGHRIAPLDAPGVDVVR
jgi:hypothetical protein